jgi:trimethylamine--corrinoid protein Co-methyltransferase
VFGVIHAARWGVRSTVLSEEELRRISDASLQILEKTGLRMPLSAERRDALAGKGLFFEEEEWNGSPSLRVRFSPESVAIALQSAPKTYTLYARNPENDLFLDGKQGYLTLDGSGLFVLDAETGAVRPSRKTDLETAAHLADALPEIAFLWPVVSAQDVPPPVQPLHELEALLRFSSKHVQAMTAVTPTAARGSIELAAAVVGGREALRKRPILSNFQCSFSPLSYDEDSLEAAFCFSEAGIPTGFLNMTIGCATAGATLAANLAQGNAEVLAGITLQQLLFPGTPTFYGSCATVLELRRGGVTCGGPEDCLLQMASCALAHYYGLPANVGTFASGARMPDWQAGFENALSGMASFLAGADMMCGAGLLQGATIFSAAQTVLDCEIFGFLRRAAGGLSVDDENLALSVIESVGPGGNYLTEEHTLAHMREIWQPRVLDRGSTRDEWEASGRLSPADLAERRARKLLEKHEPEPLPGEAEVREILREYEARLV